MALIFAEQFNTGPQGATLKGGATAFDAFSTTDPTFDNTQTVTGAFAGRFSVGATAANCFAQVSSTTLGTRQVLYARAYIYLAALPAANTYIMSTNLQGVARANVRINTDGMVAIRNGTTAVWTSTTPVALGWNRIEWRLDSVNQQQQARLFVGANRHGSTASQDSGNQLFNTGDLDTFQVGITAAVANTTFNVDSVKLDDAAWIGTEVLPTPPVSSFTTSVTTGEAPLFVEFTDTSTNNPDKWSWNFGDGGTSTTRHPTRTYNTAGTYTVTLAAGNAGGTDTTPATATITVTEPAASAPVAPTGYMAVGGRLVGFSMIPASGGPTKASGADPTNLWHSPQQIDAHVQAHPELVQIQEKPQAKWVNTQADADNLGSAVTAAAGQTILLCIYAIPGRDSGGYSSGGFPDRASYLNFINTVKNKLGTAPAIIVYEPDALGLTPNMTVEAKAERIETLRQAVNILAPMANTETYIDASKWIAVADQANLLQSVDVHLVDGFSVNTSAYDTQASCYTYGNDVVAALDAKGITGKRFTVDSSRNGVGPLTDADRPLADPWLNTGQAWCNPPKRRLGISPGLVSGQANVRATLWVKAPGESDGAFPTMTDSTYYGENAPAAGTFWLKHARDLLGLVP